MESPGFNVLRFENRFVFLRALTLGYEAANAGFSRNLITFAENMMTCGPDLKN